MPNKHSLLFPPSGSDRWSRCTASAALCAQAIKTNPDEFQAAGTQAHKVAEFFLKRAIAINDIPKLPREIEIDEETIKIDRDMRHAVNYYIKTVFFYRDILEDSQIAIEIYKAHPVLTELSGSADCVVYNKRVLVVIDFKSGVGIQTKSSGRQLICYADIWRTTQTEIETVVCQPLHYQGKRELFVSNYYGLGELQDEFNVIHRAYQNILKNEVEFEQGEHCRLCIAAPNCPVVAESLAAIDTDIEKAPLLEKAVAVLTAESSIKQALKQARSIVYEAALRGEPIDGFKLVESYGNLKWRDENAVVAMLRSSGVTDDEIYKTKIKTPNQLSEIVSESFLENNTTKPYKGLKLVTNSDRRSKVDVEDFEDLTK